MVVFATPGMLHGGLSLQIFKRWCTNDKNMVSACRREIDVNYYRPPSEGWGKVIVSVCSHLGGGGVPFTQDWSPCAGLTEFFYQTLGKSTFPEFHGAEDYIRSSSQEESSVAAWTP